MIYILILLLVIYAIKDFNLFFISAFIVIPLHFLYLYIKYLSFKKDSLKSVEDYIIYRLNVTMLFRSLSKYQKDTFKRLIVFLRTNSYQDVIKKLQETPNTEKHVALFEKLSNEYENNKI